MKMLNEIDERLSSLLGENKETKQITKEKRTCDLEEKILNILKNCNGILIFKKEDGSLEINESGIINKDLFISMMANAILLALLLTKIGGIW